MARGPDGTGGGAGFSLRDQLFNVDNDLSETKNLRKQSPEKSKELLEAWEAWNDQLKDRTFPSLIADKWWERL